ncbi:MAG: hypothetical protein JNL52_12710 [Flavobacteriales bacterium]|nr:hypothetical protein [Flavobacteriales bacterium]
MNHRSLLLPLLFAPLLLSAQALLVLPGTDDPGALVFNEKFIARNGITAIQGQRMIKRDNEPMREQREKHLYRFDASGRTTYANHSYGNPGTGRDTASVRFTYDAQGHTTRRLRNDLGGHFAYDMQLDDQGRVVRETYSRIENLGTDRYDLVPGTVTAISDEHYRYETVNDSVYKRIYTNDLGLPFREQVFSKDKLGYLRSIEDRYLISNRRSRITFRYDDKGRLAERVEQPDLAEARTTRRVWRYDAAGNVIEGELWHDQRQVEREEYLYEANTMLLTARLTKDLSTGTIHVIKFTTERGNVAQRP